MRAGLFLAAAIAIGCRTAPAPAKPAPAAGSATPAVAVEPAPPKDPLPAAVERVVQLYEAVAALPAEPSCDRARTAITAVRAGYADDLAVVKRARAERPAEVEALWIAQQPRLAAAWSGVQRPACANAGKPDLLEEP